MAKEKATKATKGEELEQKQNRKYSYEELEKIAITCSRENNDLKRALQEADALIKKYENSDFFARIEWLWRIITLEGSHEVFGEEFYDERVKEFIVLMTPPKEEKDKS